MAAIPHNGVAAMPMNSIELLEAFEDYLELAGDDNSDCPLLESAEDWAHDPTKRTQNRWKNKRTGKIVYSKDNPGGKASAGKKNKSDNPSKSTDASSPDVTPKKSTPEKAVAVFKAIQSSGKVDADSIAEISTSLRDLTVAQIKELRNQLGLTVATSGKKAELIDRIAKAAINAVDSGEASKPSDGIDEHVKALERDGIGALKTIAKLKAGDVKAIAEKVTGEKAKTKMAALEMLKGSSGKEKESPSAQAEKETAAEEPATQEQPSRDQGSSKVLGDKRVYQGKDLVKVQKSILDAVKSLAKGKQTNLKDIYQAISKSHPDLSVGQYHDLIRGLKRSGAIKTQPYTQALATLPDPVFGLYDNNGIDYYVSVGNSSAKLEVPTASQNLDSMQNSVVDYVQDAQKKNSFNRPRIKDVYDAVKKQHPDLSIGQFHDVLRSLHKDKVIRLDPYTQALKDLNDKEGALYVDRETKYYLDKGDNFDKLASTEKAKESEPPEPGFSGKDKSGHCWEDGKMVPCKDEQSGEKKQDSVSPGQPKSTPEPTKTETKPAPSSSFPGELRRKTPTITKDADKSLNLSQSDKAHLDDRWKDFQSEMAANYQDLLASGKDAEAKAYRQHYQEDMNHPLAHADSVNARYAYLKNFFSPDEQEELTSAETGKFQKLREMFHNKAYVSIQDARKVMGDHLERMAKLNYIQPAKGVWGSVTGYKVTTKGERALNDAKRKRQELKLS